MRIHIKIGVLFFFCFAFFMYSVPTHKHVIHFSAAPAHAQKNERPYDANLFRLAEFLGAIHYLRELCGANEKQLWRKQMEALVDAEGTTAIRKIKLVNNFNKGYRGYRRTYRKCTPPARAALKRFMQQGATLASSISKFGQ